MISFGDEEIKTGFADTANQVNINFYFKICILLKKSFFNVLK